MAAVSSSLLTRVAVVAVLKQVYLGAAVHRQHIRRLRRQRRRQPRQQVQRAGGGKQAAVGQAALQRHLRQAGRAAGGGEETQAR